MAQRAGSSEYPDASPNLVDYVFSHFTGIFIMTTLYFLAYCVAKRNKPVLFPTVILPGFASGVIWSVAQISWFVANSKLSLSVAFPLIAAGPGLVGALWGTFVYGEIVGKRNFTFLAAAFVCVITSAIMISLSK